MAAAFIAATTAGNDANTTLSIAKPAGVVSGDVMVMAVSVYEPSQTIASSGWTLVISTNGGQVGGGNEFTHAILVKVDDGSAGPYSVTWNGTSQWRIGAIAGYSGLTGAVEASSGAASAGVTTTIRGPSLTTTGANALLVTTGSVENGGAVAPASGQTERAELGSLFISDLTQAVAGVSGDKDTTGASDRNVGSMVAMAASPAPEFVSATAGTAVATTSSTVTLPTTAANDILILVWVNAGATATPTLTTGTFTLDTSWTLIDSGTWATGAGGCHWVRATGNHSGQTQIISGCTDSCSAQVIRISGCITSGNPIDISGGASVAATNGALSAITTTTANTLVGLAAATDDNQTKSAFTKNLGAMLNLSLAPSSGGNDAGVGYANKIQPEVGSTGAFAITEPAGTAQGKRLSAFALKPPAPAVAVRGPASRYRRMPPLNPRPTPAVYSG